MNKQASIQSKRSISKPIQLEWGSCLEDHLVITKKEGVLVGDVTNIFLDSKSRKIYVLEVRKSMWGDRFYVNIEDVDQIGENVVFISEGSAVKSPTEVDLSNLHDLDHFKGMEVTSFEGKRLGVLEDIDIDMDSFDIAEISLKTGEIIPVDQSGVTFGEDEILISVESEMKMKKGEDSGKMSYKKSFLSQLASSFQNGKTKNNSRKKM
jgi:sporulation protein YlmC with PRC-barrel domain